ncbi:hypothetical protein EVAR_81582_1 [Eumeta japonica]|uniref:Uncharacterized protein n=1 Tax=Eumeta variegata TaxID=151549 RepID=A0A4C1V0M4_EUMVA|nr:hypothetical protein EVAR_81582_1 [Eumeta japonica]
MQFFSQLQRSQQCVAGLLSRNKLSDGGRIMEMEWCDGGGSNPPEISLTGQNATADAVTSCQFEVILSMEIPPWNINPFDETEVENLILQEELLELSANEKLKVTLKRGFTKLKPNIDNLLSIHQAHPSH